MTVPLMVLICLGTGMTIRLLRRWPRLVFIASMAGLGLLAAVLAPASSEPTFFFGRSLTLDLAARAFLWPAILSAAALAFFSPLAFEPASNSPLSIIANSQGAYVYWGLAPLIIAITLDSFPLAVFFLATGLVILMLAAQPLREGRVGGAAQFLLLIVIASACLLLSNRFVDLYPLTPENVDLVRDSVIFMSLGFGLLLAVAPLSIWLGPLADEIPLMGVAFLVGVAQLVGLWLLFQQMSEVPWLVEKTSLLTILLFGGSLTAALSGLLVLGERRDGRFLANLSLIPLGHALVGIGLGTQLGLVGAVIVMLSRALGVTLVAGGLSFLRHHPERRWQIIGAATTLFGGMTLGGIPPTMGFAGNYSIYRDLAGQHASLVALLLISNALGLFAVLRVAWDALIRSRSADEFSGEVKLVPYLGTLVVFVILIGLVLSGIYPQWAADPLTQALGKAAYLK